jgi:glycosyltransferase involved in cell wall biosynthesis
MKIGLYNPYLSDVLGGGERHFLTIAECLAAKHAVDLIISQSKNLNPDQLSSLRKKFTQKLNLNLKQVNFAVGPFGPEASWLQRLQFTKTYDIFYYMTDGSFFVSQAKKNIVHFQVPFNQSPSLVQRLKLKTWQIKTSNSQFTKDYLQKKWHIKIDYVHRGSIDTDQLQPAKKQNIILNVGRFISSKGGKHCKRQDFLVKTFRKMCDQGLKNWHLILHGPIEKGSDNRQFAKKVHRLVKDYPITIHHQSDFNQLKSDYGRAKIYWHAAGYGVNQLKNPQAVGHLGLTTVEAMAAGAVPVVINKRGQPEVVNHAVNGLLWNSQPELISQTLALINNQPVWQQLSREAVIRSQDFSKQKFCQLTKKIFKL